MYIFERDFTEQCFWPSYNMKKRLKTPLLKKINSQASRESRYIGAMYN